jgi:hypothetical protein
LILKDYKLGMELRCHPDVMNLIEIHTTFDLPESDKEAFLHATILLGEHRDFRTLRKNKLLVIFTDQKDVTLQFNGDELGIQGSYAFFNYSEILKYNHAQKVIIFLEEFAHHFWREYDEVKVKGIVCEMAPTLTRFDYEKDKYIFI